MPRVSSDPSPKDAAEVPWVPPLPVTAASTVCHYTDAAGLLGILTDQTLRASEASAMNDTSEIRFGWRTVKRWLDDRPSTDITVRLKELLSGGAGEDLTNAAHVFLLCASAQVDDANQWRLYGDGGRGYAIELDPKVRLWAMTNRGPVSPEESGPFGVGQLMDVASVSDWSDVRYGAAAAETAMRAVQAWAGTLLAALEELSGQDHSVGASVDLESVLQRPTWLLDESFEQAMAAVAHTIKTRGFSGEQEARVVVRFGLGDRHAVFRAGRHGVVRYVRLGVPPAPGTVSPGGLLRIPERPQVGVDVGRLPIRAVWIGPGLNPHLAKPALRSLLHRAGYESEAVRIKDSKVTLR